MGGRESPVKGGMPALTKVGFRKLLVDEVINAPEGTSQVVGCDPLPPLVDPETGREFEYTEIPGSCFPEDPVRMGNDQQASAEMCERLKPYLNELVRKREAAGEAELQEVEGEESDEVD